MVCINSMYDLIQCLNLYSRLFFFPWSALEDSTTFARYLNCGKNNDESNVHFNVRMGPMQLRTLMTDLSDKCDGLKIATRIIGRNETGNDPVWIFNADQAVNEDGDMCRIEDYGRAYVGNMIPHDKILEGHARDIFAPHIHEPLTNDWFDIVCHFLKGNKYGEILYAYFAIRKLGQRLLVIFLQF